MATIKTYTTDKIDDLLSEKSKVTFVQGNTSGDVVGTLTIDGTAYTLYSDNDTTYTLPVATSSVLGGICLGSDTVQTVAAAAVTATASRTYAVQVNSANQAVVNVPWTNTTYKAATYTALGLLKPWKTYTAASTGPTAATASTAVAVNSISATSGRYYAVESDTNGRAFVNVPWTEPAVDAISVDTDAGTITFTY